MEDEGGVPDDLASVLEAAGETVLLLSLACRGHCLPFQNFLRRQPNKVPSSGNASAPVSRMFIFANCGDVGYSCGGIKLKIIGRRRSFRRPVCCRRTRVAPTARMTSTCPSLPPSFGRGGGVTGVLGQSSALGRGPCRRPGAQRSGGQQSSCTDPRPPTEPPRVLRAGLHRALAREPGTKAPTERERGGGGVGQLRGRRRDEKGAGRE